VLSDFKLEKGIFKEQEEDRVEKKQSVITLQVALWMASSSFFVIIQKKKK